MERAIRVLIVEDTQHVRNMLSTMLSIDGFDVVGEAHDGPSAVELADKVEADVVVVDYKMPGMDGVETARLIKRNRPDQHVILYTAFVDTEIERAAAEVGVALCLSKVEGLGVLEQEIRRLCGKLGR